MSFALFSDRGRNDGCVVQLSFPQNKVSRQHIQLCQLNKTSNLEELRTHCSRRPAKPPQMPQDFSGHWDSQSIVVCNPSTRPPTVQPAGRLGPTVAAKARGEFLKSLGSFHQPIRMKTHQKNRRVAGRPLVSLYKVQSMKKERWVLAGRPMAG